MKKYKLTKETKDFCGTTLYRIQALKDGKFFKKDELGGFIEKESNLSQEDDCWVYEDAWVYENAWVSGDARVSGNAQVFEDAWVFGNAQVFEDAWVFGNAQVSGGCPGLWECPGL